MSWGRRGGGGGCWGEGERERERERLTFAFPSPLPTHLAPTPVGFKGDDQQERRLEAQIAHFGLGADRGGSGAAMVEDHVFDVNEWDKDGMYVGAKLVMVKGDNGDGMEQEQGELFHATVVGFLSRHKSDFTDGNGLPAPLWKIAYGPGGMAGAQEDLEQREVLQGMVRYRKALGL